jgi:hypothetical protein
MRLARFQDHEHGRDLWINADLVLKIVPEVKSVPGDSGSHGWKQTGRSHVHLAGGHDASRATNPDLVVIEMTAERVAEYLSQLPG